MKNSDMPAMPCDVIFGNAYPENYDNTGLTKREYFAGLAMQGILANRQYEAPRRNKLSSMALDAVSAADALLAELDNEVSA